MKRASKLVLLALIVSLALCLALGIYVKYWRSEYVPYVPVELDLSFGGDWESQPERLTDEHVIRMEITLSRYGVPYRRSNGVLYIPRSLADDVELLWNFCTKADQDVTQAEVEQFRRNTCGSR